MYLWSRLQPCFVVFAIIALSATAAAETGARQTEIKESSADTTAANAATKAAQLLASMPACGVSCKEQQKLYAKC